LTGLCSRRWWTRGRIRAVHGHSVSVVPDSETDEPPHELFHGTSRATVSAILESGILPMQRQFVHLAETVQQARQVGLRKDTAPVILSIDTGTAASGGITFHRSASGVWLAAFIPPSALSVPAGTAE
jgi:putative RNA 2'-phosphotransferase